MKHRQDDQSMSAGIRWRSMAISRLADSLQQIKSKEI